PPPSFPTRRSSDLTGARNRAHSARSLSLARAHCLCCERRKTRGAENEYRRFGGCSETPRIEFRGLGISNGKSSTHVFAKSDACFRHHPYRLSDTGREMRTRFASRE